MRQTMTMIARAAALLRVLHDPQQGTSSCQRLVRYASLCWRLYFVLELTVYSFNRDRLYSQRMWRVGSFEPR
jgi:hypothetical protein